MLFARVSNQGSVSFAQGLKQLTSLRSTSAEEDLITRFGRVLRNDKRTGGGVDEVLMTTRRGWCVWVAKNVAW